MALSPNAAPSMTLWRVATAPDVMANVNVANGINMSGWRKMNVHVVPLSAVPPNGQIAENGSAGPSTAQADVRVWVWNDKFKKWVDTGVSKSTSGGNGLHFTFDCNGMIVFVQLTSPVTLGQSVSVFVSGFDQAS